MIRVRLPGNLQTLAAVGRELQLSPESPTLGAILDALEAAHPALRGTLRDAETGKRRPMIRFYACEEDCSDSPFDAPLPEEVASGKEPLLVIGAMAGGSRP